MNAILFLGDFFSDARCINMVDSIIDAGKDIVIIDSGNGAGTYRNQKIYHIYFIDYDGWNIGITNFKRYSA